MKSFLVFCICFVLCLVTAAQAEENCASEIKVLLVPSEVQSAVKAFNARRRTTSTVYFFDTNTLNLLSQGVILRLRTGATGDLTVKLRPPATMETRNGFIGPDRYTCEVDVTGEMALRSYSIRTQFAGTPPKTVRELFEMLSPGQKRMLELAHVSIDWTRTERIAEIKSTDWLARVQSPFSKLALELWQWPTGEVLELSTRIAGDSGLLANTQLRQFAVSKGLSLSKTQKSKTAVALEQIIRTTAH